MAGQTDHETNKYAHLDRLSTEALEEFLRADIESPDDDNDEAIFHILEVIEQREKEHPTGRLSDVDKAWADFQKNYNIPEGEGLSLYPATGEEESERKANGQIQRGKIVRLYPKLKQVGIVAAIIIGIFGMMITAQAAGIDVFGAIGRWTEETFHFVSSPSGAEQENVAITPSPQNVGYYNSLQAALVECGITEELAPTWYPTGFELSEPKILNTRQSDIISIAFHGDEEQFFSIVITRYELAEKLDLFTFEKDNTSVEQYTSGAKTFYILPNVDTVTATWSDGLLVEKISGDLTIKEVKTIIDSIGGS